MAPMTSRKPARRLPAKFLRALRQALEPDEYNRLVEGWSEAKSLAYVLPILKEGIYDDGFAEFVKDYVQHLSPETREWIFSPKKERRP